ncbi:PAS domain S-box protein [Pedobacter sp. AW1-32]|uniref:PAS domain S-box protein n=1 Tax=Pedobacter sp. AW1-32 TaxID=3383026 RepID=UPI003FF0760F
MAEQSTKSRFDLEYFFELYPDLICIAGEDGYLKQINPAVSKLLGYTEQELFSVPMDSFLHPDEQESIFSNNENLRDPGKLSEYEYRYLTKTGDTVWLSWTSMFVEKYRVFFAIAKNVTDKHTSNDQPRFSAILKKLTEEQQQRFSREISIISKASPTDQSSPVKWMGIKDKISIEDQNWLQKFESLVRGQAMMSSLNIDLLSREMAVSERQLYRQIQRLLGITPKKLVTLIRFHIVWEAIALGKHLSVSELSSIAGFTSVSRFKVTFNKKFGIDITELI